MQMQYDEILGLLPQQILFELLRRFSTFDEKGVTPDKVVIGPSSPTSGHSRNTTLIVSPNPGSGLVNPITVYYNRLDFGKLSVYQDVTQRWPIHVGEPTSVTRTSDLLDIVAETYGIVLGKNDIVDEPITVSAVGNTDVDITPTASNQVWIGVLPLVIQAGGRDLNLIIRNNILEQLRYFNDDTSKVQGPLISRSWFIPANVLPTPVDGHVIAAGSVDAERLAQAMTDAKLGLTGEIEGLASGTRWTSDDVVSPLNIGDAVVIADPDKLAALPFGLRTDTDKVTVLQLSNLCSAVGGIITLYETKD